MEILPEIIQAYNTGGYYEEMFLTFGKRIAEKTIELFG